MGNEKKAEFLSLGNGKSGFLYWKFLIVVNPLILMLPHLEKWHSRPLSPCYAFLFVDCMFTTVRNQYETKKYAVYTILGYTMDGKKEILGIWLNETESKHKWMQIFDEIKSRGVEDVFSIH